jgi:hypothetical protein
MFPAAVDTDDSGASHMASDQVTNEMETYRWLKSQLILILVSLLKNMDLVSFFSSSVSCEAKFGFA